MVVEGFVGLFSGVRAVIVSCCYLRIAAQACLYKATSFSYDSIYVHVQMHANMHVHVNLSLLCTIP